MCTYLDVHITFEASTHTKVTCVACRARTKNGFRSLYLYTEFDRKNKRNGFRLSMIVQLFPVLGKVSPPLNNFT